MNEILSHDDALSRVEDAVEKLQSESWDGSANGVFDVFASHEALRTALDRLDRGLHEIAARTTDADTIGNPSLAQIVENMIAGREWDGTAPKGW
ncbi:MAG: hypothetical protein M0R22_13110 [Dehalococcoidia bacterium]|nr:hypothetical protein [Dehalococcoidia bacterium]